MENFPVIETERLILDQPRWSDIPKIVVYAGDERIAQTTLNIPHPYHADDAIFWLNNANQGFKEKTQYTFAMRARASEEFIGGIGLMVNKRFNRAEIGYWVATPFWGQGFATEATSGILAYGFETLQLNKIYATHLIENPASGKVMRKNRMILEGELKDHYRKDGVYKSIVQYRLTRAEYFEAKSE